jgi:putative ABC transport system permease protein
VGFDATRVLLFDLRCAATVQPAAQCGALVTQLLDRLTNLPGVTSVAASTMTPTNTVGRFRGLALVGKPATPDASGVFENVVSPRYFDTMGVPILRGRDFTVQDVDLNRKVAILNERTARYVFGDENAIGRTIAWGSAPDEPIEIIGVVGDTRQNSLREDAPRMVYTPLSPRGGQIAIKASGAPLALVPAVRDQARQVSRDLLVARVRTMEDQVDSSLVRERALMLLTSAFAIVAAILTCIGLYGVMSFQVARRTREIGIRLALGETPRSVLAGILRRTTRLSVIGIAVGLVCAVVAARLISAFLYGLSPQDPLTLATVALCLVAAALLAGWLPARHAARIDPLVAIRSE